jgi:hypothetical protein
MGGGDQELFVGKWDMQNETDFIDEDSFAVEGADEYMDFDIFFTFGSENELNFQMAINVDFNAILADMAAGEDIEIVAEPLKLSMSMDGTYELVSGDVVQFNFDETTLDYSPQEYCFSVMGVEECLDMGETIEGIEVAVLGDAAGYYEITENTLTLWDDDCDYPTDQTCAIILTK